MLLLFPSLRRAMSGQRVLVRAARPRQGPAVRRAWKIFTQNTEWGQLPRSGAVDTRTRPGPGTGFDPATAYFNIGPSII